MSSAPHVERFKGTGWEECHEFIIAIRARALWEGKQRDSAWIADFAGTLFWRKALSWHSQLPQDVRQDWFKLEAALFNRWSEPEAHDEPQINPIPAAAPSLNPNDKANHPLQGVLKVVIDGSNRNCYVRRPISRSPCFLTYDTDEALYVRCNSLSSATLLERIWDSSTPEMGQGSTDYANLTSLDSNTLTSTWGSNTPFQLVTCTILVNGEVIPVWKTSDSSEIPLSFFVIGDSLFLVPDPGAYGRKYSGEKRAKLFIEPTD
ncbi:hypothetical protein M407DRAFT_30777 [Tulasnella calospora MUT 4182]|uniref:Uncharacterized protein n=1 Tax=Tulasnella calospora MUT 4182 TaxID=1051891 RepID=A0A0C3Q6T3_9AGAM|nr:hypothetical protein M407DRAFT_30777 [Tulasnella calospora MUT 4182]